MAAVDCTGIEQILPLLCGKCTPTTLLITSHIDLKAVYVGEKYIGSCSTRFAVCTGTGYGSVLTPEEKRYVGALIAAVETILVASKLNLLPS